MATRAQTRRRFGDLLSVAVIGLLFVAAYLLPPDTSLQLVEQAGVLRACVPAAYPPLVTSSKTDPGFDVSVLDEIAKRMNVRLALNVNMAMGRDFNPTNWRITRAQCEVIAGGVVTSPMTRSFLETIGTGVENGWTLIARPDHPIAAGQTIGVFPGSSGLDRAALSAYLRQQGATVALVPSAEALGEGLRAGRYDSGIAGALDSRRVVAAAPGFAPSWLPESLGRFDFGFGLWKGDITLKRRLVAVYRQLDREGFLPDQRKRYGLPPA